MAIDKDKVKEGLESLETQLINLREKKPVSLEEYKTNEDLQAIVERRLQNSVQACIDIGMHIACEKGPRKPKTYADIFIILAKMKIIDSPLSKKMAEKAGFRNVLSHDYAELIDKKVYAHLQDLKTFEEFAKSINNFLKKS